MDSQDRDRRWLDSSQPSRSDFAHTRHLKDDLLLLSTLVHEEYHWHADDTFAAITEFKAKFPILQAGGLDGPQDEESSYLRVIVCYAEQKMKALVETERVS